MRRAVLLSLFSPPARSPLLEEEPRLFFMHFWAVADAKALATTLRKAVDLTVH